MDKNVCFFLIKRLLRSIKTDKLPNYSIYGQSRFVVAMSLCHERLYEQENTKAIKSVNKVRSFQNAM